MAFQVQARLRYDVVQPSTMLLCIHALPGENQILSDESFEVTPPLAWEEFPMEIGENRYVRLETGGIPSLEISYRAVARTGCTMVDHQEIRDVSLTDLRRSAIPYLFPSRYCQSDRLERLAHKLFGGYAHPYDQVVAIADWIFDNVDYLSGSTNEMTSAYDTLSQRAGVCRDFSHLAIAFCRALSIPARYFTGYACDMQPQDFHACFEACVGNRWFVFDPARLAPLNGLVRIATGRDAADTSFATIFGKMVLTDMAVSCVSNDFSPLGPGDLAQHAILIEP